MSRPQEFQSQLADKNAAVAEASTYIFDGWLKMDCNPIAVIDWNAKTIERLSFNETLTAFEVRDNTAYGINETERFQLIYDAQENKAFTVAPSFGGFTGTVAAAAYTALQMQLEHQPFCLLDWQNKTLHHLIRDHDNVVNIIQNYPEEPLGILTTYENMEL